MAVAVIVGAGIVGTATGSGLAELGHDVAYCDIDPDVVARLRQHGLRASTSLELRDRPTFLFVSVPTPIGANGRYDLSAIRSVSVSIGEALRDTGGFHTVVMRSTVPPGTCEGIVTPLLQEVSGKRAGADFAVASNPEFLRARFAVADFLHPWMTVVGAHDPATVERLRELYAPLGGEFRAFHDPSDAELVKCAHNYFNAAKISFWNEMGRVAGHLGLDIDGVAETVARSAEASFNPLYGIRSGRPFGGHCLPKDTQGLLGFAADLGIQMPVLEGVIELNEAMELEEEVAPAGDSVGMLDPR